MLKGAPGEPDKPDGMFREPLFAQAPGAAGKSASLERTFRTPNSSGVYCISSMAAGVGQTMSPGGPGWIAEELSPESRCWADPARYDRLDPSLSYTAGLQFAICSTDELEIEIGLNLKIIRTYRYQLLDLGYIHGSKEHVERAGILLIPNGCCFTRDW